MNSAVAAFSLAARLLRQLGNRKPAGDSFLAVWTGATKSSQRQPDLTSLLPDCDKA